MTGRKDGHFKGEKMKFRNPFARKKYSDDQIKTLTAVISRTDKFYGENGEDETELWVRDQLKAGNMPSSWVDNILGMESRGEKFMIGLRFNDEKLGPMSMPSYDEESGKYKIDDPRASEAVKRLMAGEGTQEDLALLSQQALMAAGKQ